MKRLALGIVLAVTALSGAVFEARGERMGTPADVHVSSPAVATDGDEITFEIAAPTAVEMGQLFRIEFVVNAIRGVELTPVQIEDFMVVAGPTVSTGSNIQIDFDGNSTKTETTAFTYLLQALSEGLHTIPAARVTVDGKSYSTKPVTIEVVAGAATPAQTQGQGQAGRQNSAEGSMEISDSDIFVRAVVSRSEVYKNEPVVVSLKLYSRLQQQFWLESVNKFPSFNGFWQQDITGAGNPTQQRETVDGRVYDSWTLKEYLLYPHQLGELSIEPFEATIGVRFQTQGGGGAFSIIDQLMGGGNYQDVRRNISSRPVRITVRDWPAEGRPASFDGAVGSFELEATPPPSSLNANTSGTYVLRLSGTGNFPLIRTPRLEFPSSFEQYNVTTSDNTRHTPSGTIGYREFSYPFIARTDGLYTIPAVEFSYFDPRQKRYHTLSVRETSMEIVADTTTVSHPGGIVSGLSREEFKIFDSDIQFIKRGSPHLRPKGRMLLWSPLYLCSMGGVMVAFIVGLVVLRGWVRNRQSDRFVRGKRANKVALRRFRAAEVSMKQGDKHGFYDEMLKALWGYIGDRLDIPMASLTKERIREELFERSVPEAQSDEYIRVISECEEAQYSPVPSSRMEELYREGITLISELESTIK